ncbi:MAG: hypothetical protein J7M05_05940 [Anaerolineae bacterium]|nr:hypothetical protein [Anaerolineae bacterium]
MEKRRRRGWLCATSTFLALLLWVGLGVVSLAECPGNALVNGGFEGGFSERGAGEVVVANGWEPWWQEGPFQDQGYNRRPEYKPEDANRFGRRRVREGNFAQKWGNTYATHHGGLFQRIHVPPGSLVKVHAWAQAWSSKGDNPAISEGGKYALSVGIDPTGSTDFNSPNVVWSPRNETLDQWVELSVEARAQGDTVTIYLRGDAEWRMKHNDAYFDDVCVTYIAPKPKPTNTPRITNTPKPTPTPSTTPTPTHTPTFTPSPTLTPSPTQPATPTPETGTIQVCVFEDRDGDGLRSAGEPALAGAQLALLNMQRTPLAKAVSEGKPYVFQGLKPGNYIVTEQDPTGYISTSPNQWAVALVSGSVVEITFADRFAASPTPTAKRAQPTMTKAPAKPSKVPTRVSTPTPQVPAEPFGQRLYKVSGILVAALALLLPAALRLLRARL